MKTEMEGEWKAQMSYKLGKNNQQMLNLRARSWQELKDMLAEVEEDHEFVQKAASAFDGEIGTQVPLADVRAVPPPVAQMQAVATVNTQQGEEVGPLTVSSVDVKQGTGATGKPYTKYNVILGGGAVKASTFDGLLFQVAQQLMGKMAMVRVQKGKFGYDLINIRPAA